LQLLPDELLICMRAVDYSAVVAAVTAAIMVANALFRDTP